MERVAAARPYTGLWADGTLKFLALLVLLQPVLQLLLCLLRPSLLL